MMNKNKSSSEILTSVPYVWVHLAATIFIHSVGYGLLRTAGYGENVSLYLIGSLVLTDIILPNLRFPLPKEARQRFQYTYKYTFPFSILIYTLIILFANLNKVAIIMMISALLIISKIIFHLYFLLRRKREGVVMTSLEKKVRYDDLTPKKGVS